MEQKVTIPVLKGSYLMFKKEIKLWEAITNIEEKKRAGTLVLKLPDKAKTVALDIPLVELTDGVEKEVGGKTVKLNGIARLLEALDEIYLEDMEKEKYKCYDDFRNFKRGTESIAEYLLEFDKKIKRLEEFQIKLPGSVLAYEVLNNANISEDKTALARATVVKLDYENMRHQIKKISLDGTLQSKENTFTTTVKEDTFHTYDQLEDTADENTFYSYNNRSGRNRYRPYRGYFNGRPSRGNYSETGWNKTYRGYTNSRGKTNSTVRGRGKMNPKDQYGNTMVCAICQSTYHFVRACPNNPEKTSDVYNENIALFQNSPNTNYSIDNMKRFTGDNFGLAVLDSGCNKTVCGQVWLNVYLESLDEEEIKMVKYETKEVTFKFGDNKPSLSNKRVTLPAKICEKSVHIIAQIVDDQIPMLISRESMQMARMILNFDDDTVTAFGVKQKLIYTESGHCSIALSKRTEHEEVCLCSQNNMILFSNMDIETSDIKKKALKLHKQFSHPTAERLKCLIRTAGKDNKKLLKAIDEVSDTCDVCRRYKKPESKPIVSFPLAKDFNDTVAMDIKCIDRNKNLYFHHMIDHKTRFSTVKLVKSKDKEVIVESIFTQWICLFGRPRKILSDNGGEYINSNVMDMCDKLGVHILTTGAESPWSNGLVERHHALIAQSVTKIREETKCSLQTALAWAVHAKNTLSNINGFSPYQLLLGRNPIIPQVEEQYAALPTLENETPSECVAEHIKAIYSARKQQIAAECNEKIKRALLHKTRDVYSKDIKNGDLVYYKRDDDKRWRGPGTVLGVDGKLVFVRHGGTYVRCHMCRVVNVNDIYYKDNVEDDPSPNTNTVEPSTQKDFEEARALMLSDTEETMTSDQHQEDNNPSMEPVYNTEKDKEQKLCSTKATIEKKKPQIIINKQDPFSKEKEIELQKWVDNNVYEEISVNDPEITDNEELNPISVRWVLTDNEMKRKARLVAKGYQEAALKSTDVVSPTSRKESLRILFTVTVSNHWIIKSLDIVSAFLQGKEIQRPVYLIPPRECGHKDVLWKLKKCVYGLSDGAKMWYSMVKDQIERYGISKCPHDDAFFYWINDGKLEGIMAIHVDDFVYAGTNRFRELLFNSVLKEFDVGECQESEFTFLGLEICQNDKNKLIQVSQKKYVLEELKLIQINNKRKNQKSAALAPDEYKSYRSSCGQLIWLAIQTRPDISYDICILSNYLSDPNVENMININKVVKKLQQDPDICITFKEIPNFHENCKIICYSDAAYGNLPKHGSQSGYIIFLAAKDNSVMNPIAWKSIKIDRVCRSTLEAECLALNKAIDHAVFIQQTIMKMYGNEDPVSVKIECYIDNKSLEQLLKKTKDPEEKRLICIMAPIREMVEKKELTVDFIRSSEMPADILTKRGVNAKNIKSLITQNNS